VHLQVAECTPSVATYIETVPDLSVWADSLRHSNPTSLYEKDCPGRLPNGFTIFISTDDSLAAGIYLAHNSANPEVFRGLLDLMSGNDTVTVKMVSLK